LSKESGICESSISRYISGEGLPDYDAIKALKKALDVPYEILFNDVSKEPRVN
jgi:transcriptional regulator with XRE-family HTH domain